MFNTYEFTFAGESSAMYGLYVCDFGEESHSDVAFGNQAEIIEAGTPNRIRPIHFGVNYHEEPLEFSLILGTDRSIDRYEMQSISLWLTGYQDYQWLQIDQPDMQDVLYRCLITSLQPITVGWIPHAFRATVRCDCPYAYGQEFQDNYVISGETKILFRNESTTKEYFKPDLIISPAVGTTSVSIKNTNDNNREFAFTGLPSSDIVISIDNKNGIITEQTFGYNLYDNFNMNFFRCICGDNNLVINGDCQLTIQGRFLYNVSG